MKTESEGVNWVSAADFLKSTPRLQRCNLGRFSGERLIIGARRRFAVQPRSCRLMPLLPGQRKSGETSAGSGPIMNFGMSIFARSAALITSYGLRSPLLIRLLTTRVGNAASHGI